MRGDKRNEARFSGYREIKMRSVLMMLIFSLLLAALGPAEAGAEAARVSLLVIDADSYLAQSAVNGLESLPGFEVRAFTLADLSQEPEAAAFVTASRVLLVDIMDDKLAQYVIDQKLLEGRTVFALRGSKDDESLKDQGFIFNRELYEYFSNLSDGNIRNMLKRLSLIHI